MAFIWGKGCRMKIFNTPPLNLVLWTVITAVCIPLLGRHDLGIGGFYGYLYDGILTIIVAGVGAACMGLTLLFGNRWSQGKSKTSWPLILTSVVPYLAGSVAAVVVSNNSYTILGPGGYGAFHGAVIAHNLKFVGALFSFALVLSSAHILLSNLFRRVSTLDASLPQNKTLRRALWIFIIGTVALLGVFFAGLQMFTSWFPLFIVVSTSAFALSISMVARWSKVNIGNVPTPPSSSWGGVTGAVALLGIVLVLIAEIFRMASLMTYTSTVIWSYGANVRLDGMQKILSVTNRLNDGTILFALSVIPAAVVGMIRVLKHAPQTRLVKSAFALGVFVPLTVGALSLLPISAGIADPDEALGIHRYLSTLTQKNPTAEAIAMGRVTPDVKFENLTAHFRTGEGVRVEATRDVSTGIQHFRSEDIALVQKNVSNFSGMRYAQTVWPISPHITFNGKGRAGELLNSFVRIFKKAKIRTATYIPDYIQPPISGTRKLWFYLDHPDMNLGSNRWILLYERDRVVVFNRPSGAESAAVRIDLNRQNNYEALSKQIMGQPSSGAPICMIPISTITDRHEGGYDLETILSAGHAVNCTLVLTIDDKNDSAKQAPEPVAAATPGGVQVTQPTPADATVPSSGAKFSIVPKTDLYAHRTDYKKQLRSAQNLSKQKKWSEATAAFQQMNAQFPNSAAVLGELTWAAYNDQKFDLVATYGAAAVALNESDLTAAATLYNMGRAEQDRGNIAQAVTHYLRSYQLRENKQVKEKLLALDPGKRGTIQSFNNNWRAYNPKGNRFRFEGKAVHPHCVAELLGGFGNHSPARKEVSLPECTKNDEPFKKTANSATFDSANESSSYTVVANKGTRFLIDFSYVEGGTQTRETLLTVEITEDRMLRVNEIHSGDRCDQGYLEIKPRVHQNNISYSYTLWARDALNLDPLGKTLNTGGCKYGDCLSSAMMSCFMVATLEYNLLTGEKVLKTITLNGEEIEPDDANPKRACFNQFAGDYSGKRNVRFSPKQFTAFTKAYADQCLNR